MEIVFIDEDEKIRKSEKESIVKSLTSQKDDDLIYMFFTQSINSILRIKNFPLCVEEVLKVIVRVISKKETEVTVCLINKWERCRYCEISYKACSTVLADIDRLNEAELKVWSRRR